MAPPRTITAARARRAASPTQGLLLPPHSPSPPTRPPRRRLCAAVAAAAPAPLVALVALLALAPTAARAQTNPAAGSVIVIGAGLSGLTAADALCAKGFTVKIIEGRARTGGRTFTTRLPITNTPIEVGAGWIHDARPVDNSVAKFVQDNGIATQIDDEEEVAWLVKDAPPAAASAVSATKFGAWETKAGVFEDQIATAYSNWLTTDSLQKMFDKWKNSQTWTGDDLSAVTKLISSGHADLEYGATMSRISARWCDEGEQKNGDEMIVKPGYSAIVSALQTRIASRPTCRNAITLNARVAEINVTTSPTASRGVYVKLANGTTLSAKFAVTTLPLGVLKAGAVRFVPPLSTDKNTSLAKLGMGLLNKVALVYDRSDFFMNDGAGGAAWPSENSWFLPILAANNTRIPIEGNATEFWNHAKFYPGSNTVVMLIGGDTAANWEALYAGQPLADRDRQVAQKADALFRQLFPSSTAVLKEYVVTRWAADPFSLGSYSYIGVGGAPGMRTKLCATHNDLLYWAGEACSTKYPSTANGAMDSGLAAANAAMLKFTAPTGRR